jgi:hypothetical protein
MEMIIFCGPSIAIFDTAISHHEMFPGKHKEGLSKVHDIQSL